MRSRTVATCLVVLVPILAAGCTGGEGLPTLEVKLETPTVSWGEAAVLTIKNVGPGPAPPPINVHVVAPNGTVVRTYEDIKGGHPLAVDAQISVSWNGYNDHGNPVIWGNYTFLVDGYDIRRTLELLRPPHHAITVDPIPKENPAGEPMRFVVNNTGTTWVNGTLHVAAGKGDTLLYNHTVDVRLAPEQSWAFNWDGRTPEGEEPEADKYLVGARIPRADGPTLAAQDVFTLT